MLSLLGFRSFLAIYSDVYLHLSVTVWSWLRGKLGCQLNVNHWENQCYRIFKCHISRLQIIFAPVDDPVFAWVYFTFSMDGRDLCICSPSLCNESSDLEMRKWNEFFVLFQEAASCKVLFEIEVVRFPTISVIIHSIFEVIFQLISHFRQFWFGVQYIYKLPLPEKTRLE